MLHGGRGSPSGRLGQDETDTDVYTAVRRCHRALGHPARSVFLRKLRVADASSVALEYAEKSDGPVCRESARPGRPAVASTHVRAPEFSPEVWLDATYVLGSVAQQFSVLSITGGATS